MRRFDGQLTRPAAARDKRCAFARETGATIWALPAPRNRPLCRAAGPIRQPEPGRDRPPAGRRFEHCGGGRPGRSGVGEQSEASGAGTGQAREAATRLAADCLQHFDNGRHDGDGRFGQVVVAIGEAAEEFVIGGERLAPSPRITELRPLGPCGAAAEDVDCRQGDQRIRLRRGPEAVTVAAMPAIRPVWRKL